MSGRLDSNQRPPEPHFRVLKVVIRPKPYDLRTLGFYPFHTFRQSQWFLRLLLQSAARLGLLLGLRPARATRMPAPTTAETLRWHAFCSRTASDTAPLRKPQSAGSEPRSRSRKSRWFEKTSRPAPAPLISLVALTGPVPFCRMVRGFPGALPAANQGRMAIGRQIVRLQIQCGPRADAG